MKTRYPIFFLAMLLAFTGLSYSQESVYSFPFENEYRLPPMNQRLNTKEISSTYQTYGSFYTTEITGIGNDTMAQTSYSHFSSTKVMDAVKFLEFYMEEQLLSPGEEKNGTLEMSIIYYNERGRFNAGSATAFLTLGISALLGISVSTKVTDVEIKASFFDSSNREIAVHRGVGRGKKTMSLYTTTTRKAHQRAIRDAIENLNEEVLSDPRLHSALVKNTESNSPEQE